MGTRGRGEMNYDPSDYNAGLPVGVDELTYLIEVDGKPIAKDGHKLTHFLQRVYMTVDEADMAKAQMRRQIEELTHARARMGAPTTLSPVDAVKFLDPEQLELVVDRISRQRLANLRSMVEQANSTLEIVRQLQVDLGAALSAVNSGEELTGEQAQAAELLAAMQLPEVHHQHVLAPGFFSEEDLAIERELNAERTLPVDSPEPSPQPGPGIPAAAVTPAAADSSSALPSQPAVPDLTQLPPPQFEVTPPTFDTVVDPFADTSPQDDPPRGWADDLDDEQEALQQQEQHQEGRVSLTDLFDLGQEQ